MKPLADKIIIALDASNLSDAEKILRSLKGLVTFYKVGFELFTAQGWKAVELVRGYGARVFLDLKLHDIPNTVGKTMAVLCDNNVDMVTVHALGGFQMMKRAKSVALEYAKAGKKPPVIVAVTILTSHTDVELARELGIRKSLQDEVCFLAALARDAGLDGIVSSPQETELLRRQMPEGFLMVTPGIRPRGADAGDQKRTFTPSQAVRAGADYLVIGRPVTEASDPAAVVQAILDTDE